MITDLLRWISKDMKEEIRNFVDFNNWKGYIGLYFSTKELQKIAKEVNVTHREIKDLSIKEVYELYNQKK